METLFYMLLGSFITFLVSWFFAWRASKELRAEAAKLRRYINLLMKYLESAGVIDVKRNAAGEPIEIAVLKATLLGHVRDPKDPSRAIPMLRLNDPDHPRKDADKERLG